MGKLTSLFKNVDVIIFINSINPDPNFSYFSGLSGSPFEGSIFLMKEKEKMVVVPRLDFELAKSQAKFTIHTYRKGSDIKNLIGEFIKGSKTIGLNYNKLNLTNFNYLKSILKGLTFRDVSKDLNSIRMIKTKDEISKIKRACLISSRVAKEIPDFAKTGMTELQVAAEMEKRMKIYGGDDLAFTTIVASGKNSASPHHYASKTKLKKGDMLVTDFGCKYKNYCSDITRTFIVGKPSKKQKEIFDLCFDMQKTAMKMLKPGVKPSTLQEKMNEMIGKYGPMIHGLGHGMGIEVHEPPSYGPSSNNPLKVNMITTIEPGIYLPKVGGVRIEDDLLITKTGSKSLTNAPRDLISI